LSVISATASDKQECINLYLKCPNCKLPSCAWAYNPRGHGPTNLLNTNSNTESLGIGIRQVWPAIPLPNLPEAIPEGVKQALIQAESNFVQKHNEAAAVMYRKSLELGLKFIDPSLKGMLASRIEQLGKAGKLTSDLVSWANEIKILGNEGAHDEDPMDRSELESLRGFVEMILKYLFSLPHMVEQRRKIKTEVATA
jgi:hypothetical protein